MSIANLLVHAVDVQSVTVTKGASGGEKDSYTTVYPAEPCRIAPAASEWKIYYASRQLDNTHHIYFGRPLTVKEGYLLLFGNRIFRVLGYRDFDELGRVTRCDVQELV